IWSAQHGTWALHMGGWSGPRAARSGLRAGGRGDHGVQACFLWVVGNLSDPQDLGTRARPHPRSPQKRGVGGQNVMRAVSRMKPVGSALSSVSLWPSASWTVNSCQTTAPPRRSIETAWEGRYAKPTPTGTRVSVKAPSGRGPSESRRYSRNSPPPRAVTHQSSFSRAFREARRPSDAR